MTEDILWLEEICGPLFGLSVVVAKRKAALGQLPVPAFRLNNARKGPYLVRRSDLARLVHENANAAEALRTQMQV